MEDHAHRVAMARSDPADAVTHINAIEAARPLHRPDMHGKGHGIALAKRRHFSPRLHARSLFGQHEFATGEIFVRLRQQDHHLQREDVLTVQILVQAIVIALGVAKQQRR